MKRKVNSTPTKIWSFNARQLPEGAAVFDSQLYLAHQYTNRLIEIERSRRGAYLEACYAEFPRLRELDTREAVLEIELQKTAKANREPLYMERRDIWAEQKKLRAELRRIMQPAHAARKERSAARNAGLGPRIKERLNLELSEEMLAEQWPEVWKAATRADCAALLTVKAARAEFVEKGLPNGTYLLCDKAMEAIRRDSKSEPRFRRWTFEGRVGVQVRNGAEIQIVDISPARGGRASRLGETYARVRLRLTPKGQPETWSDWSIRFHRPLPKDAVIKWAWVKVSRVGDRKRYELQLTIESAPPVRVVATTGVVCAAFGWTEQPDGSVIAGTLTKVDGELVEHIVLPAALRRATVFADELRSHMDKHFNAAMPLLSQWLGLASAVPDWCREDAKHMHLWESPRRLARVARRLVYEQDATAIAQVHALWRAWKGHRGKLDLYGTYEEREQFFVTQESAEEKRLLLHLEWWRRKNSHLWQWEEDERRKLRMQRKDLYRVTARRVSGQFATIILPQITGSKAAADTKGKRKAQRLSDQEQRARAEAAPYELRRYFAEAFGSRVVERSSARSLEQEDAAAE